MLVCCFGQALAGGDSKVSGIVLQQNEHQGRKRHHPQERVAKLRASRHVRCPVAWVDEAHGYQEAGSDVLENLEASVAASLLGSKLLCQLFLNVHANLRVLECATRGGACQLLVVITIML